MTPLSFHVQSFGCRANQADGAVLEQSLLGMGLLPAADAAQADLVVLNTCTVTAAADDDARHAARRIHRFRPQARILATGCYAQRAPQELATLPGVTWVVGNGRKDEIPRLVQGGDTGVFVDDLEHSALLTPPEFSAAALDRTRPTLKIQEGCNARCSFCIIPAVRGRSRSWPMDAAIAQVRRLAEAGYPEVVLSGINLGRYGRDLTPRGTLADLVERLLEETPVELLRLSSVEPLDYTDRLLRLMAGTRRIARHVHAPLQSGSWAVLRAMHRRYRPEQYEERLRLAHALLPDAAIGADVMVGFPGESDADFAATQGLIERLPFTYLHVFTYSPREGTAAAGLPRPVSPRVAAGRSRALREIAVRKHLAFRRRNLGRTLEVVTLGGGSALSSNYLRVALDGPAPPPNRLLRARISALHENGVWGTIAR